MISIEVKETKKFCFVFMTALSTLIIQDRRASQSDGHFTKKHSKINKLQDQENTRYKRKEIRPTEKSEQHKDQERVMNTAAG